MLGILCSRPKLPLHTSLSLSLVHHHRTNPIVINKVVVVDDLRRRRHHTSACRLGFGGKSSGGAASIWHAILPAAGRGRPAMFHHEQRGEGSWNVVWDARPARWLRCPDSAWLLFGVCACLAAPLEFPISERITAVVDDRIDDSSTDTVAASESPVDYKVKGVLADGRCLFRAIAHMTCLRNGEEAPDEDRQRELADELRAQVVDELLRRRKETEWFIEGDFDTYVKRIQQPYVWGGEPELLMASHVLKTPISVFMVDRSSDSLSNIANYGEEYQKDEEVPIKVLFHGYGHYDILESISDQRYQKAEG